MDKPGAQFTFSFFKFFLKEHNETNKNTLPFSGLGPVTFKVDRVKIIDEQDITFMQRSKKSKKLT